MKTIAVKLVLMLALLLAVPGVAGAADQPPSLPHYFYGTLKTGGVDAPAGATVEARGAGVLTGSFNPIVTTVAGKYGDADPSVNVARLLVQGDIADGAVIEFFVNGVKADQTAAWHSGKIEVLNLTAGTETVPPPVPTMVSPGDGSATGATPVLDWTDVTDPSGVTYGVQVDNNADFSSPEVNVSGLVASTYAVPDVMAMGVYRWRVKAVDGAGNASDWTASRSFEVTVFALQATVSRGWNMIAFPLQPDPVDWVAQLGDDVSPLYLYTYDPVNGSYVMWSTTTPAFAPEQGKGYWVKLTSDVTIDVTGNPTPSGGFTISLKPGWNQIGNPFSQPVAMGLAQVHNPAAGETVDLPTAHNRGWVSNYLFDYDAVMGRYVMESAPGGVFKPWRGYWVRAFTDVDLIMNSP